MHWLLLVVGLTVAVLPAVLAAHRALDEGWRPVHDNTFVAMDAVSFASGHPPLLGLGSSLTVTTHIVVNHPGPSESWLLGAVQVVWPGTRSLVVSAAALAACAGAVVVLAARRIAGPWAALAAGAVAGEVAARLGTPVLADIWNPHVPILPLAAAVTAAWAAALARWKPGLPLAVVFGTISSQTHLTYIPLVVVAVAPAIVLAWVDRRARRPDIEDNRERERHGSLRGKHSRLAALILAMVIGFIFWLPPVLSDATTDHSNVVNLWRAVTKGTGEPALGIGHGLEVFDRVVGRPPPVGPPAVGGPLWVVPQRVSPGVVLRVLAVLVPVLALLAYALRRRDRVTAVIGTSVLATDLTALAMLSRSTFTAGAAVYETRWLWAVAILHWGGIAIAALHVARQRSGRKRPRGRQAVRVALAVVAVILAIAAMDTIVRPLLAAAPIPPDARIRMHTVSELHAGLGNARRSGGLIVRAVSRLAPATDVALETAAALIIDGVDVKISSANPELRKVFGSRRAASAGERGELLVFTDRSAEASMRRQGFEPVTATPPLTSAERRRLRATTEQLRAQLEAPDVRWSKYGAWFHKDEARPDFDQMLRTNQLGAVIYAGELQGRLPGTELVETFTDLQRRARPETSFIVWRRSTRNGRPRRGADTGPTAAPRPERSMLTATIR